MVADFVSAEYGFCRSKDGKQSTQVLFRAGKGREGYFDNDDVRAQLRTAMEICKENWPEIDHVFIFDNAKTHTKRAEGALSALKMPKGPSAVFGVDVNDLGEDGKLQYVTDGSILKKRVPMSNGKFSNGREQPFYFPSNPESDHPLAGQFKGMANILWERGFKNAHQLKAQCSKKFTDCPPGRTDCCCRCLLYNQPDFAEGESILETDAKEFGYQLILLPKFHCELNPIEQCWGYAKRKYRMLPASSKDEDLERNVVSCMDDIPLLTIRRFAIRALRFMDAYRKGLNGNQAAWASKKYRGHRIIPDSILADLEKAGIN
ncbi:hypothetical protein BJ165DRAFT_1562433 [Panaeolus papilionaceus]|nr:hypothetical protein BJ165DRAFT_1562433 [Panaeolus papilionaceus]